ncbi:MAG: hypothetical protein HZB51_16055 [Chloroflexi bacterium]|nr:hypothetical protein [Chloroflexota bacterium]
MKKHGLAKWLYAGGGAFLVFLILTHYLIQTAWAQGVQCPPGFTWQRLSGVGCIQTNCQTIPNARYGYTGNCICNEGYGGCAVPVDYSNFDRTLCGPFCPYSSLVHCLKAGETCPDQKPAPTLPQPTQVRQSQQPIAPSPADVKFDVTVPPLEELITGGKFQGPTPAQTAGAGLIAGGLLGAWVLGNLLGAPPIDNLSEDKEKDQKAKTNIFRIRNTSGGEFDPVVSFKVQTVEIQELIWDRESQEYIPGRKSKFTFAGAGVTLGLKAGLTSDSSWQTFATERPARLEDFEGWGGMVCPPNAQIGTHGVGWSPQYRFIKPKAKVSIEGWSSEAGAGIAGVIGGWWEMHGPY